MTSIENDILKVSVKTKGAELDSLYNKVTELEYMWSADVNVWPKKSPVLFPIVGTIKNDTYYYQDKEYSLTRHGFARETDFLLTAQTSTTLQFTLQSNEITYTKYPFSFRFDVLYSLEADKLQVTYKITNTGNDKMYFSVGGHPAFALPLKKDTAYNDYYLEFNKRETAARWPISKDGLIE